MNVVDERSKLLPNTTQTPNVYLDHCMAYLTGDELKVLMYTVRRTLGFGKTSDQISLSQYADGITAADGRILDMGTGLSRPTVSKVLKDLVKFGLIIQVEESQGNDGAAYAMQMDDRTIQWDKLVERKHNTEAKNIRRVEGMRKRLAAKSGQSDRTQDERSVAQNGGGQSDRTRAFSATDTQNPVETQYGNLDSIDSSLRSESIAAPTLPEAKVEASKPNAYHVLNVHDLTKDQIRDLVAFPAATDLVYIGRAHLPKHLPESPWANPFKIKIDGTRQEVIAKYRDYLLSSPDLLKRIPELRGKTLVCWCAPDACHGDVLAEFAAKSDEELAVLAGERFRVDPPAIKPRDLPSPEAVAAHINSTASFDTPDGYEVVSHLGEAHLRRIGLKNTACGCRAARWPITPRPDWHKHQCQACHDKAAERAAPKVKKARKPQPRDCVSDAIAYGMFNAPKGDGYTSTIAAGIISMQFGEGNKPTPEQLKGLADEIAAVYAAWPKDKKEYRPGKVGTLWNALTEYRKKGAKRNGSTLLDGQPIYPDSSADYFRRRSA